MLGWPLTALIFWLIVIYINLNSNVYTVQRDTVMGCFEIENSLVTDTSYALCSEDYFMCECSLRYDSLHSLILKFHS